MFGGILCLMRFYQTVDSVQCIVGQVQCSREAKQNIKDPRFETMADAGNCISSAKVCDTVNDCLTTEEKSADENIDCSKIKRAIKTAL